MFEEHSQEVRQENIEPLAVVTVVVPIRNEERFIGKCLDSLIRQDYPSDRIEVLVVDGRSEDASRAIVLEKSQEHNSIRLLDNSKRIAPAALNIGILNAEGDIVVRLDGHHFAASDFVSKNVACLSTPGVDCVGGPICTISQSFVGEAISKAMSCPFGVGNAYFRYSQKEKLVDTVANPAYRREVFDRIGLFDEELVRNQDDEFNYRLRAHGGRILLSPEIRSWYVCRSSLRKLWRQYFEYGYWKVRVLQKHPRQMRWRQFVPPVFVGALLGTLALSAFGILWPLALIAGTYLAANLAASLWVATRSDLRYLTILPLAFVILHISYGIGFLNGLIRFADRWGDRGRSVPRIHDETDRIRAEYARRAREIDQDARYSLFNPGALFTHTQRARHVLAMLRRHDLHPLRNRVILEVGCGGGGVLRELLAYGADVSRLHGIDLRECALHNARLIHPDLPLACANGQVMPYPDRSFDLVLQFTAFSSVLSPDVRAMMAREMMRVVKPEGLIMWYDFWLNPTNARTRGVRPREIAALFPECRLVFRRITLAPPLARRLAGRAWGVCLMLEWLRLFNTHYLVAIRPQA